MPKISRTSFWMFCLLFFLTSHLVADNAYLPGSYDSPGFDQMRDYQSGRNSEFIDPFTGALKLLYVDAYLPGNGGLDITIQRYYQNLNDGLNGKNPNKGAANGRTLLGSGWDLHFGRVWPSQNGTLYSGSSPSACKIMNLNSDSNPVLELSDGSKKLLVTSDSSSQAFISKDRWMATCLPSSADSESDGGLVVHAPNGLVYTFDKKGYAAVESTLHSAYLVTEIKDPSGNWLKFQYKEFREAGDDDFYTAIESISSSDGRNVYFYYTDGNRQGDVLLDYIRINGNTVADYSYTEIPNNSTSVIPYHLMTARLKSGFEWEYEYYTDGDSSLPASDAGIHSLKQVQSPGGAVTNYKYQHVNFGDLLSGGVTVVSQKNTSGTKIDDGQWNYDYQQSSGIDTTLVTHDNGCEEYQHHAASDANLWKVGVLKAKKYYNSTSCSSSALRTESYEWYGEQISSQVEKRRMPLASDGATFNPQMTKKTITQDGLSYVTEYNDYDNYGNAKTVIERTGVGGLSRTRQLTYYKPSSYWMIHLPEDETVTGFGQILRLYDSKGRITSEDEFGVATTYTYHSSGDLETVTDARGNVTTYTNYYRGVPKNISRPEGISVVRIVSASGNITSESVTDQYSTETTGWEYDVLNRITHITTPLATDHDIDISYSSSSVNTMTITRGDFQQIKKYNGFGNLYLVQSGHVSNANIEILQEYDYDELGRQTFASYPRASSETQQGTSFQYDIIGRVKKETDTTNNTFKTYQYLSNSNKVKVTDERNYQTTYTYRSYGNPDQRYLMNISAPEGVTTVIARDVFGQVESVSQGGVSESYEYFANKPTQLWKTTRPEVGTTVFTRDEIGNMKSRKVGVSAVTSYIYDNLNRLKYIDYPVGTDDVTFGYDKRNALRQVTRGDMDWSYSYDNNGNLKSETLLISSEAKSFVLGYGYDSYDNILSISYPSGSSVSYNPDVLGRATRVGAYATNIKNYSNGQVKSYDYGNGLQASFTQDTGNRFLPKNMSVSGGVVNLTYAYDNVGNVNTITDAVNSANNKTLGYDGLNRLTSASGVWGGGTIMYDTVGNITYKSVGGKIVDHQYDANNRLSAVTGSISQTYTYDEYGNITSNGQRVFSYNDASNLTDISSNPTLEYVYDGHDRRVLEIRNGATARYSVYNQAGKLMYEEDALNGNSSDYYYLGSALLAKKDKCGSADTDGDGLSDCVEARYGYDPLNAADGAADDDNDGLSNAQEYANGTSFTDSDSDDDSIPDGYEVFNGLDPLADDSANDLDGDTLTNLQEYQLGTDPQLVDTDGDGQPDNTDSNPLFNVAWFIPIITLLLN